MPQAPISHPSPLRQTTPAYPEQSDHSSTSGHASSGPGAVETGNYPGARQVKAWTTSVAEAASLSTLIPKGAWRHYQPSGSLSPVVAIASRPGTPPHSENVAFDGTKFGEAIMVNPALAHMPHNLADVDEDYSPNAEFAEQKRAEAHEQQVRRSETYVPQVRSGASSVPPVPVVRSGYQCRTYDEVYFPKNHAFLRNFTEFQRFERVRVRAQAFLTSARLPAEPSLWSRINSTNLERFLTRAGDFHVCGWESGDAFEDSDSEDGERTDALICTDWENEEFDDETGATLIGLNGGTEWLAWFEDRTTGFNLTTGQYVPGSPSEVYSDLKRDRPGALIGLDKIFVGNPAVSNILHALRNFTAEEAQQHLAMHCHRRNERVIDMSFDAFSGFVQGRFPATVVARYDRQSTDIQTLGTILDAYEGRFLMVNLQYGGSLPLQDKLALCFDGAGLTPSLSTERSMNVSQGDNNASRSGKKDGFREAGMTPQQYLQSIRTETMSPIPNYRRFAKPSEAVRRSMNARDVRLYNPSTYTGNQLKYRKPSEALQQYFSASDQIGIISTGPLRANAATDDAALARVTEAPQTGFVINCLRHAGVTVESSAELARTVFQRHGVWPEIDPALFKSCVEGLGEALPVEDRVKITLEVIESAEDLPVLGDDPAGRLLQFRREGELQIVFFYKSQGAAFFRIASGEAHPVSQLGDIARREKWWREGPVTLLHFEGKSVRPLIDLDEPSQEQAKEDGGKRKRPVSTSSISSTSSDLAMRPKPKMVRPGQESKSPPR